MFKTWQNIGHQKMSPPLFVKVGLQEEREKRDGAREWRRQAIGSVDIAHIRERLQQFSVEGAIGVDLSKPRAQ